MISNFSSLPRRAMLLSSVAALGFAAPAFAQPVDEDVQENAAGVSIDEDAGEGSEAIVVTGSRIQRRDLTSTSPLAVIQDEEFKLSGAVNVEQVINTLPQVIPGTTSFSNNPGGGVATLNLRGLGVARTMVLVNNRRWMFFDTGQVVDLNTIPQFLIDSVDVVTGGASAVYGSDALAGVVNFRLKTDLNGFEGGASYALTEEGDGARFNAFMALGTEFADGRGSVTVFGEYYKRKSVFADDRAFSSDQLIDDDGILVAGGSSTVEEGRLLYDGVLGAEDIPGNFEDAFFAQPGTSRPRLDTDLYNFAPANYLMVPQERWLLGGYGSYEISDSVTAFLEAAFVNNRVENELAATPVTGTFSLNVAQQRPFLSDADFAALQAIDAAETAQNVAAGVADDPGMVDMFIQRRVTETGARNQFDERNAFRVLAGVKGPAFGGWNYEAYYSYARTRNAQIQSGNISRSAFQAGLDGTAAPINIFGRGTLTPGMVDQISILAQNNNISTLQVASASLSGSLGNFGMGADDIGLAVGVEYRSVASSFIPDTALSSGDVIGFNGGDPTDGGYNVREVFAELRLPIIADRPGFHRLELSGAARYSDYSLGAVGGVWTYAAGAEWAPIPDLTFRGQYQRAVRAPNVGELFGGQANGFPPATDPCGDSTPVAQRTAALRQLCIQTGVPADLVFDESIQEDTQIEGLFGGNPNLQEETSDTYTIGAVIRPSFIPRLAITIDGYDITVTDAISVLGGSLGNTLNLCYNVIQDLQSPYCQAVVRNPRNGQIGGEFIPAILNANIGKFETRGIDLQVDYSQPLGMGLMSDDSRLNFFFLGTYTDKFDITPVADLPGEVNECAGRFGILACGEPTPKWKWTSRLSWIDGPLTSSLRWRHVSGVSDDDPDTDYVVERVNSYDLFDLSFAYDISDQFSMAMGVNNLFDKKPQLIGDNQQQSNTYPGTYDPLGRDYFVSANFRF
ncbi:TonB-dependent receptor domain-containing protein [Enterovirga sp. GCM10030262]|uniref:TonB-dependent receptor domain-containing protein n=1 Tax=Enterovirga sp. GCM10030262 TaxID=3273391 RepID=UPI0036179EBF